MTKRKDLNQLAKSLVDQATGASRPEDPYKGKNRASVENGRLGGPKGGLIRASKLTPEQRSEIAKKAAAKRWQK